jgi:DNA-binding NarL/FixJ family response regulator
MRGRHRVQSTAADPSSTFSLMDSTAQKWVLDRNARVRGWIERDASLAPPTGVPVLRGAMPLAKAGSEPPREPPREERSPTEALRNAAQHADEHTPDASDASVFWDDLTTGRATRYCEWFGATRSYAVALLGGGGDGSANPLGEPEALVVLRVLCGHQQKVIATELQIAHSTASKRYAQALETLDLLGSSVPLPLVLAAQNAARVVDTKTARRSLFEHEGHAFAVLSVPRPQIAGESGLTVSEQSIALQLVEGQSRHEIAASRSTSVQTVSCQLRAVFAKLRLTGRYGAIRRAAEMGWFQAAGTG